MKPSPNSTPSTGSDGMECQKCKSDNLEQRRVNDCSCHINPPCSACVDAPLFCNECGYEQEFDRLPLSNIEYKPSSTFKVRTLADLDRTKIDWISSSHTHFSMIKEGCFPVGTEKSKVIDEVKGSFGGRFDVFNPDTGYFKYVAYTD